MNKHIFACFIKESTKKNRNPKRIVVLSVALDSMYTEKEAVGTSKEKKLIIKSTNKRLADYLTVCQISTDVLIQRNLDRLGIKHAQNRYTEKKVQLPFFRDKLKALILR